MKKKRIIIIIFILLTGMIFVFATSSLRLPKYITDTIGIYVPKTIACEHADNSSLTDTAEYWKFRLNEYQLIKMDYDIDALAEGWFEPTKEEFEQIKNSLAIWGFSDKLDNISSIENLRCELYNFDTGYYEWYGFDEIDGFSDHALFIYDKGTHEYYCFAMEM